MPSFSARSLSRLETCDHRIIRLFKEVIRYFDCTVVCGYRSKEDQNAAYEAGNSKLKYPKSKHNGFPSKAIDCAPYIPGKGIVWEADQCYFFAGVVMGTARALGIPIRWGGDWDKDNDVNDQTFNDLVHFEIDE